MGEMHVRAKVFSAQILQQVHFIQICGTDQQNGVKYTMHLFVYEILLM